MFEPLAQNLQCPPKHRMTIVMGKILKRRPEKLEHMAVIIPCLMSPALRQVAPRAAKVKRPHLPEMIRSPAAQIPLDHGVIDPGLLCQFTQGSLARRFPVLDGAFHQLSPGQGMPEQQKPGR